MSPAIKDQKAGWNLEHSYYHLGDEFSSQTLPKKSRDPSLVIINHELASDLGLDFSFYSNLELAQIFSGNNLPDNAKSISQAYGGHQFGHFAFLGDGRAHLFGEQINKNGDRFDLQFKGSGVTPYSRRGDGSAALKPMLREFLISEAMFALGVPTSRSLAVVTTGDLIERENLVPAAILTRVAASHIRIGTFQYFAAKQDFHSLEKLAKYTIWRHYPKCELAENPYLELLRSVMMAQINLVVNWLRIGFVHGVMNSDNASIAGETIDYGPCAFIDNYDLDAVFSSIDRHKRYSFGNQSRITKWNLARFAESILPLINQDGRKSLELASELIESFDQEFQNAWMVMMKGKLGLLDNEDGDSALVQDFLKFLENYKLDYVNSFNGLLCENLLDQKLLNDQSFRDWRKLWRKRVGLENSALAESMLRFNPIIIPRNYQVEEVLQNAQDGDLTSFRGMLKILQKPYDIDLLQKVSDSSFQKSDPLHSLIHTQNSNDDYQTFCGT